MIIKLRVDKNLIDNVSICRGKSRTIFGGNRGTPLLVLPNLSRSSSKALDKLSSCDLRALIIDQIALKAEFETVSSGSTSLEMSTGKTIVPNDLLSEFLIARPTAWMISTWLDRGSMNATPSSDGTSIPSVRHRALLKRACRPATFSLSLSNNFRRLEEFIAPVMVPAQKVPEGLWSSGNHSTILGKSWAKATADLILP